MFSYKKMIKFASTIANFLIDFAVTIECLQMPYIQRELQPQITRETPPKAVVIFGARQIGKTSLLTELSQYEKSVRWFNGDLITDHRQLQFSSSTDVELTLRQADTIIIDEAQRFPNIGLILKQLVDVM